MAAGRAHIGALTPLPWENPRPAYFRLSGAVSAGRFPCDEKYSRGRKPKLQRNGKGEAAAARLGQCERPVAAYQAAPVVLRAATCPRVRRFATAKRRAMWIALRGPKVRLSEFQRSHAPVERLFAERKIAPGSLTFGSLTRARKLCTAEHRLWLCIQLAKAINHFTKHCWATSP
jgi:hypothetical protein